MKLKSSVFNNIVVGKSGAVRVFFKNGRVDQINGIPKKVVQEFTSAESAGKFYNKKIREKYSYRTVREKRD